MKHLSQAHRDWILATIIGGQQLIDDLERQLNSDQGMNESAVMAMFYKTFGMSAPTPPDISKREEK